MQIRSIITRIEELAGRLPRLANFNVAVREWNDQIVFLHKIVEGGAVVLVEHLRVSPPHLERESITLSESASRHGHHLTQQCLRLFEAPYLEKGPCIVVCC